MIRNTDLINRRAKKWWRVSNRCHSYDLGQELGSKNGLINWQSTVRRAARARAPSPRSNSGFQGPFPVGFDAWKANTRDVNYITFSEDNFAWVPDGIPTYGRSVAKRPTRHTPHSHLASGRETHALTATAQHARVASRRRAACRSPSPLVGLRNTWPMAPSQVWSLAFTSATHATSLCRSHPRAWMRRTWCCRMRT